MEPQRARDGSVLFEGVRLTHPDRILYPGTTLTKLDVARYYAAIKDWALPHLSRRLLTLVRSPAVGKKTFYQKHIGDEAPAALKRFELKDGSEPEIYPYIDDLQRINALPGRYVAHRQRAGPNTPANPYLLRIINDAFITSQTAAAPGSCREFKIEE